MYCDNFQFKNVFFVLCLNCLHEVSFHNSGHIHRQQCPNHPTQDIKIIVLSQVLCPCPEYYYIILGSARIIEILQDLNTITSQVMHTSIHTNISLLLIVYRTTHKLCQFLVLLCKIYLAMKLSVLYRPVLFLVTVFLD